MNDRNPYEPPQTEEPPRAHRIGCGRILMVLLFLIAALIGGLCGAIVYDMSDGDFPFKD